MSEAPKRGRDSGETGKWAESIAARYLELKGYKILERNYRCRYGEIDLVAVDRDTLAFIEVRCRSVYSLVSPQESITGGKRRRLAKTALIYLAKHRWPEMAYRFDVISIEKTASDKARIELIKGAFDPETGRSGA